MVDEDIFLKAHERPSTVDVVIDRIKDLLINQKLMPGDLIPSEQVLADKLGVSRGSVREAMKILNAFGVVEIKRGSGTFISHASNKKLFDSLLFQMLVDERSYQNLIEIRGMMELFIVRMLIKKASDEELASLDDKFKQFEKALANPLSTEKECNDLDISYHRMMGAFCHNPILENMYSFIVDLFVPTIHSRTEGTAEIHRNLQSAINSRNEELAIEYMMNHTQIWSKK